MWLHNLFFRCGTLVYTTLRPSLFPFANNGLPPSTLIRSPIREWMQPAATPKTNKPTSQVPLGGNGHRRGESCDHYRGT
jgi:hypothetical protein